MNTSGGNVADLGPITRGPVGQMGVAPNCDEVTPSQADARSPGIASGADDALRVGLTAHIEHARAQGSCARPSRLGAAAYATALKMARKIRTDILNETPEQARERKREFERRKGEADAEILNLARNNAKASQ